MIGAVLSIPFPKRVPDKSEWCAFDPNDPETLHGPDPEGDGSDVNVIYETQPVFCSRFYQEALQSKIPPNPFPGPYVWQGQNVYGTPRRIVCDLDVPSVLVTKRADGLLVGEVVECRNHTGSSSKPQTLNGTRRHR